MHTISFALVLLFTSIALADQVAQSDIEVVDGGTVRVHGEVIHIIGIDTPKLGQKGHCGLERMLAARAMSRLRQIVRSGERIEAREGGLFMSTRNGWLDGL
jgi:endonuclease YncB( thermonuclease family)